MRVRRIVRRRDAAGAERVAADGARRGTGAAMAGRYQDGRLGQAVCRQHRRGGEAVRGVGLRETADRLGAHRFGAIEGDLPAGQVDAFHLLRTVALDAQIEGEIGSARDFGAVVAMARSQMSGRWTKRDRRHQHAGRADIEALQRVYDQPHVVIERHPADIGRASRVAEGPRDHRQIGEQVGVADHDALRRRGRAGGVLQKRDVVGDRLTVRAGLGVSRGGGLGSRFRRRPGLEIRCRIQRRGPRCCPLARSGQRDRRARHRSGRAGRARAAACSRRRWRRLRPGRCCGAAPSSGPPRRATACRRKTRP